MHEWCTNSSYTEEKPVSFLFNLSGGIGNKVINKSDYENKQK